MLRKLCLTFCLLVLTATSAKAQEVFVLFDVSSSMSNTTTAHTDDAGYPRRNKRLTEILAEVAGQLSQEIQIMVVPWGEGLAPGSMLIQGGSQQDAYAALFARTRKVDGETILGTSLRQLQPDLLPCRSNIILILTDEQPTDSDDARAKIKEYIERGYKTGVFIVWHQNVSGALRFYRSVDADQNYVVEPATSEGILAFIHRTTEGYGDRDCLPIS